ncbi:Glycosyl transferase family 2 [Lachnospiraceae bacterium XPB1003]|nr:Glycosyl transferase family 2 [Lachnospiraceae bacterium XPB1003]
MGNSNTPMVSIIIPVYNGANYLREAIDSALAQTYSNFEVIVVNDGSNDGGETDRIATSYGEKIRYFRKENGGVASALNMGINHMKGDYFSWLSHDDLYLPEKLECDVNAVLSCDDITTPVHGGWINFITNSDNNDVRLPENTHFDLKYYESGIIAVLMGLVDGCSVLIHRSYFDKYGLFDEELLTTQDYAKWFEMFRDKRLLFVNRVLVRSRIHDSQTSRTNSSMSKNVEELHIRFAEEINEKDAEASGIDYYKLLCIALTRFDNLGISKAVRIIEDKIEGTKEPGYGFESRRRLNTYLTDFNKDIFLYGMGKRGKALIRGLKLRGISVCGFSDKDDAICDQVILGISGRPLEDIPKQSLLIVTVDHGEYICDKLKNIGFEHVITYNEIEQLVSETIIDKKELYAAR